jgi:hypothetical protein
MLSRVVETGVVETALLHSLRSFCSLGSLIIRLSNDVLYTHKMSSFVFPPPFWEKFSRLATTSLASPCINFVI